MNQRARLRVIATVFLGVAFLASLAILLYRSRRLALCRQDQAAVQQSLHDLQEALRQRNLQEPPVPAETPPAGSEQAALAQRDANIRVLTSQLSDAQAKIADLQDELNSSNQENTKARANAEARDLKAQQNLQSELNAVQQQLNSVQGDSQASRLRIAALEADNARLRSQGSTGSVRAEDIDHVLSQLQDLNQRRDDYLNSIIHRYHDVTNQLHAMSGMLAAGQNENVDSFSGAALLRIQSALASCDDDLRQLSELDTRARQLEMKLHSK
jgi:chromosome segregation ATPase